MKLALSLVLFLALVPALASGVAAQSTSGTGQRVAALRAQLLDVQAKEDALQARARQLNEDLKPENIERSLAGIGSTKPEELRDLRRRQLTIERESLRTQLNLLSASRERLESAIRTAESAAYQQSAEGFATPLDQTMLAQNAISPRWSVGILVGLVAVLGIAFVIALIRRNVGRSN
ncbi:MAG: hypothetical protein ABJB61_04180 [bacterium]